MSYELNASMMCANFACLEREVNLLDAAGIDVFHIDIMDGLFVDNFGMGYQDMEYIRSATKKRVEVHLMVNSPWNYLDVLANLGIDIVYIHPEVVADPATTLEKIRKYGITPGIAINPGTSIAYVHDLLYWVDRVLVLCVNPGHSGREFIAYTGDKIKELILLGRKYSFDVVWDGACTFERIQEYAPLGVKGFVLGTSVLFGKSIPYQDIINNVREQVKL